MLLQHVLHTLDKYYCSNTLLQIATLTRNMKFHEQGVQKLFSLQIFLCKKDYNLGKLNSKVDYS